MVNVAEVVALFPQSSVAVKITVSLPVPLQALLSPVELFVHVIEPQASLAVAPPLFANHVSKSFSLPHDAVKSLA